MANISNTALTAVPDSDRVFNWHNHASLWFSLGVGLLVMQVGAYLVPAVGSRDAALAIVLGSLIGAGLLAWTARLGSQSGLSSAALMHATYGSAFAKLPVLLNMAQLIGWTTFELVIMRDGTAAISKQSFGLALDGVEGQLLTTLLWGGVLVLLLSRPMTQLVRKLVSRVALPLVIASLLWLTWQFGGQVQAQGLAAFWARPGDGSMGLLSAMDLVIAMPVSWLPLVADYARYGKSGKSALSGTWLGYALANIWCYALGVLVVTVAAPGTDLVSALLLAQGGLLALSLILVDEVDNAYGDVYSGAVSGHSIRPVWLESYRIHTDNTHGTGCTLSSAIAAHLALGATLAQAVENAREFVRRALVAGAAMKNGAGSGALNHGFEPLAMYFRPADVLSDV